MTLLGLLEPSSGRIVVDGIDISSLSHDYLRSHIVAVAEEPFFFPGTVRQNLDPYDEVGDDILIQALSDVGLWEAVNEKGGLNADYEKDMFSHGQRQLFNICRAIVRTTQGKVTVLDEITSR